MALRFIGIDPETGQQGSPTVWVDEEQGELVLQGWKPGERLEAECAAFEVPGHASGILEMRDSYGVGDEVADFDSWRRTGQRDVDPASAYWTPWVDLIRRTVSRGVVVRRARIVSEPVTDYIRYEHAGTVVNLHAGEQVRWLPTRQASDIALPGNDCWVFDGETVLFNHFSGDGDWSEPGWEVRTEPAVARLASAAFEAVWERGVPHEKYSV